MRRLVGQAVQLNADLWHLPPGQLPLAPDCFGQAVTKAAMSVAFVAIAATYDTQGARITGRSARVTGAQRMALAGFSE